jgi:hypothetical protein
MTGEERRLRPEHHVVHDYANLRSSGLLITDPEWNRRLGELAPVNSHVWHQFYTNCRKMYEFFRYHPHEKYLRAEDFLTGPLPFTFKHWTWDVQHFMEGHQLHVGGDRTANTFVLTGSDDKLYLEEFKGAWEAFLGNLKPEHKEIFRDEIETRLDSEYRHCGTLSKEFIL